MRFAIKTRPEHQAWEELRDIWVAADDIPLFESVWNWDHFYPLTGDLTGPNFEGWTMLAAMAALTKRIRIGFGAAWNEMECKAYGIPLPPLKERFDRFDEGVEAITLLLSQTVSNYSGTYVQLTDARCEPKPIQRPYPPITIGGNGRKRTLRTAARFASEWNATIQDPAQYAELKGVLADHCAAIGRDFSEITCSCLLRSDGEDDLDRLVATIAQWRDAGADLAVIGLPLHAKPDFLSTLAEALAPLA
jgi:alkanesulfonate monooxygenase SsuD/methylene tetrahydromethanopterin reductase-like flavin-dependent oxidoreductase (luciferase family)